LARNSAKKIKQKNWKTDANTVQSDRAPQKKKGDWYEQ